MSFRSTERQTPQQARHRSLPTLLRWIWETASAPECKMVLLLNLDTLGTGRNLQLTDSAPPGLTPSSPTHGKR
ncbi:hypothetical protein [Klebsiella variicola]|uniref:hypothetical protein n=1 Tax=Klebsiella variicola TaxID=244366 RepID=UPI001D176615|nr:hypothetical protein [Klebsiella variicola]